MDIGKEIKRVQAMIRTIELAHEQQRLMVDFMAVAQNHLGRDAMLEWCDRFRDIHAKVATALDGAVHMRPPAKPTPPGIQVI